MEPQGSERDRTAQRQGAIIFDQDRRIRAVTRFAEQMLGWSSAEVEGAHCHSVFDCRSATGESMCDECGLADIFERRAIIESMDLRMRTACGPRAAIRASFWYLPPSGRITEPRAMAVLWPTETDDAGH
jgi:PAS domain-containing protein